MARSVPPFCLTFLLYNLLLDEALVFCIRIVQDTTHDKHSIPSEVKGITVRFDLSPVVGSMINMKNETKACDLLVYEYLSNAKSSQVAIRNSDDLIKDDSTGNLIRSYLWELVPENWINYELDFLDGFSA